MVVSICHYTVIFQQTKQHWKMFYKMREHFTILFCRRTAFFTMIMLAVSMMQIATTSASSLNKDNIFTVKDIEVDVRASSASQARDQAFQKAQRIAFERLIDRILTADEKSQMPIPEDEMVASFVNDFEITRERVSSVRYIGTYTFRFKKEAVSDYLDSYNMSYTDVGSKAILVLPYLQTGTDTVLWGDANLWLQAWNKSSGHNALVPTVSPIGDLQDISDIGYANGFDIAPDALENMLSRYNAGDAVMALALINKNNPALGTTPDNISTLTIMLYSYNNTNPQLINRLVVTNDDIRSNETLFDSAVRKTRQALQDNWKKQTSINAQANNNLNVRVRFNSMGEWIETQRTLRSVQGIEELNVVSLSSGAANINIIFSGTERRLRLALAQADIILSQPRLDFNNVYGNQQQGSPLVYDLYLNKYRPQNQSSRQPSSNRPAQQPPAQNTGGHVVPTY